MIYIYIYCRIGSGPSPVTNQWPPDLITLLLYFSICALNPAPIHAPRPRGLFTPRRPPDRWASIYRCMRWCWNVDDGIPSGKCWNSHSSKINFSVSLQVFYPAPFDLKKGMLSWKNPGWIGIFWFWVLCRCLFLPHLSGSFVGPFAKDFIHVVDDAFSNV